MSPNFFAWPTQSVHRRSRGFTLVEVLVAVAIVAIALAAGSRAAGTLLNNSDRLSQVTSAQWCAENFLTDLKLSHTFPDVGTSSTACTQLGHHFTNRVQVQSTMNPSFRRVDVQVLDEQGLGLMNISTVLARR